MDLSRKWLNEFVDLPLEEVGDRDFAEAMSVSGSKVEVTRDLSATICNVVVGRITKLSRHPDSDHLLIAAIDIGGREVSICTGAWNVHEGDLVPVALDGARLPNGAEIRDTVFRGVPSQGMLCSLRELGMTAHDFPEAVIVPAAILGDYRPLDPARPSISADIKAGDRIFGKVCAAEVRSVAKKNSGWACVLSLGGADREVSTPCTNLHAGDLVAFDTAKDSICTLADLHARQEEFPHCLEDGILILPEGNRPGTELAALLGLDDHVVEFEITPNRPDCLCMIGLAREAAVTFGKELKLHEPKVEARGAGNIADMAKIVIEDGDLCPRYTARMVRNVRIAPSPEWMRERIRNAGMRPINNIVDITNYVMLEYGQPMHAFDFSCVKDGEIRIRRARAGESITTLDGNERKLTENMLCICDVEKPVAVAGVMGGANSEIVGDTAMVLFESANFSGPSVRRTATALGMRTDASSRFEKGLDVKKTETALERACELVEMLGAGEVVPGVIDAVAGEMKTVTVKFEPDRINALLGTQISEDTMKQILLDLGFAFDGDTILVPSWRGDVEHYSDIAEEVARFYGYNEIPTRFTGTVSTCGGFSPEQQCERRAGEICRSLGLDEIITYSFISPAYYDRIRLPADSPLRDSLKILNPLGEDTSIMRTTVLPSMLEILTRNYNYRNAEAAFYEIGKVYSKRPDGLADEPRIVSLGAYGSGVDFFTLKGWVEELLGALCEGKPRFTAQKDNPSYHPGRCAEVFLGGEKVGVLGQIHPAVAANYGVDTELYCAELRFDAILAHRAPIAVYRPLPRYPSVSRDIAVVCDESVSAGELTDCILASGGEYLKDCRVFDVYRGSGVAAGRKSVAFSLTLRADDQTLTDEHADQTVRAVLAALGERFGAVIR